MHGCKNRYAKLHGAPMRCLHKIPIILHSASRNLPATIVSGLFESMSNTELSASAMATPSSGHGSALTTNLITCSVRCRWVRRAEDAGFGHAKQKLPIAVLCVSEKATI
jgi:hypothetical protein